MRGVVMYAPGDVRVEDVEEPKILAPTDAIIRLAATCICGSDLWPYRDADEVTEPFHWVTSTSASSKRSAMLFAPSSPVSSSSARSSPRTTPARSARPATRPPASTARCSAPPAAPKPNGCGCRWPTAPWSPLPTSPPTICVPSFLAASDVLGTGWFGAVAAEAAPGKTVAVVGDGAVGADGGARRQAARRRAHHRDEPPPAPPATRTRIRRHRHRRRTRFGVGALIGSFLGGRLGDTRPYSTTIIASAATAVILLGICVFSQHTVATVVLIGPARR